MIKHCTRWLQRRSRGVFILAAHHCIFICLFFIYCKFWPRTQNMNDWERAHTLHVSSSRSIYYAYVADNESSNYAKNISVSGFIERRSLFCWKGKMMTVLIIHLNSMDYFISIHCSVSLDLFLITDLAILCVHSRITLNILNQNS